MPYAARTKVSPIRTLEEIRRTLSAVGAKNIETAERTTMAAIQFELSERRIRFVLPLPALEQQPRSPRSGKTAAMEKLEQTHRARWRALLACIKAKLVSAQSGIETVEEAFLANIVTKDGSTVWQDVFRRSASEGYLNSPKGGGLALPAGEAP